MGIKERSDLVKISVSIGKAVFLGFLMSLSLLLVSCNHSPDMQLPPDYQDLVKNAVLAYRHKGIDFQRNLIDYQPLGSFLHFEDTAGFNESKLKRDSQGIPLVKYGEGFYYNPVTIAQYALYQYGKFLQKQASFNDFKIAADKLLKLQDSSGAFRYAFPWRYYLTGKKFKPGWVSGMAQGQALSVFARAYAWTKDLRYLDAGNKAFRFLLTPVQVGGVLDTMADLDSSLERFIIFEQYPVKPASYTLNGFMFTLIGCYDWWQLDPGAIEGDCKMAAVSLAAGLRTLEKILRYYDVGGFASYDLGYITYHAAPKLDPFYFAVDIYLLHALYAVSGNGALRRYELLWASYVSPSPATGQRQGFKRAVP
jgi:hypothetical protein